jgi:catechol 2,3-dioxygenase-like lactoylglutathione lyase family enzyme
MHLHHLAVRVSDLDRAEAFYAGLLGLSVRERYADERGEPRSIWLTIGDAFLALERAGGTARKDEQLGWHCVALAIDVSDRERWRERLAAAGHHVHKETDYTLYLRDPDGAEVALSHYPIAAKSRR